MKMRSDAVWEAKVPKVFIDKDLFLSDNNVSRSCRCSQVVVLLTVSVGKTFRIWDPNRAFYCENQPIVGLTAPSRGIGRLSLLNKRGRLEHSLAPVLHGE